MPSSPSASSSGSSSPPMPTGKIKQDVFESSEPDSSEGRDTSEEVSSADEDKSDSPLPLPLKEDPVLSHAERRRQKRKQRRDQLADTAESQSPRKKRKLDDGTASDIHTAINTKSKTVGASIIKSQPAADDPVRQKRQNSVWVGNLSFRTTKDTLRGFFDGVGMITRIHMPMRRGNQAQGENMGFAYVDFKTSDAKTIAITLSEGQLDGRNLLIKDGDDFNGRPIKAKAGPTEEEGGKLVENATTANRKGLPKTAQKILRAQKQHPAPTLFLGNLGFKTTEGSIRELFEAHRFWKYKEKGKKKGFDAKADDEVDEGEAVDGDAAKHKDVWIRKIRMSTFEDSGACKGFAFVDFTSIEDATEALVNPRNHRLDGRDLVVEYASPDAVRRGGGRPRNPKGDHGRKDKSGDGGGRTLQQGPVKATYTKQRRPPHIEQEDGADGADATTASRSPSRRPNHAGCDQPHTRRARPGAALANAQRQSAAILPSQGQKILF